MSRCHVEAAAAKVSKRSNIAISPYHGICCAIYFWCGRLQPRAKQSSKRLVKAPKVYVRDSGLVHALLALGPQRDVLSQPVAGGSWEGWVIENLLACAPPNTQASYYRTAVGAEIDLLLDLPGGALWAVEIKRFSAPTVSRGYHIACDDVGATRRLVVSSATQRFPMAGGLEHVPRLELMQELLNLRRAQLA